MLSLMTTVQAQNVIAGMFLVNIGLIDKVQLFPDTKLVRIICTKGDVLSAAFYWYRYDTLLTVNLPS